MESLNFDVGIVSVFVLEKFRYDDIRYILCSILAMHVP